MFYIPYNKNVANWYYEKQKDICKNRINRIRNKIEKKELIIDNPESLLSLISFIENNLKKILIDYPYDLLKTHEDLLEKYPTCYQDTKDGKYTLFKAVSEIFNYKSFKEGYRDFAYELAKKLNVSICPYCNREFIFTVFEEVNKDDNATQLGLIRPEFDHFFPQSKFPLLALSFCNLIPSGHICNSNIKHDKDLDIEKHLHPYIENKANIRFTTELLSGKKDNPPEITISHTIISKNDTLDNDLDDIEIQKVENTFRFFHLSEIYQYHSNIALRIQEIFNAYPPDHLYNRFHCIDEKSDILKEYTKEKVFEILFSEFNITSPENEILGNLKNDLFEEFFKLYSESWQEIELQKSITTR